ncbi:p-hydroxycinnamoyl CoA hydratase/lyase [Brevundimonas sp.]|uniref:p-hydroxycinnamoyl CoA hydratase/lyase n=1 Tax=Brevundimonas sp. TaxID=1871086 RepID=UPI0034510973
MVDNAATADELFARLTTVKVEFDEGIAWVTMNRPEKRNAMSPTLNREMLEVLEALEFDERCGVLVLTGAGDSFTAGMDLKEYFRETDNAPASVKLKIRRAAGEWQWRKLRLYPKPTIAMANGWCFGGGFSPLVACDLAIAADEATFGLSEINWGIIPAGTVTRAVAEVMNHRAALYYIMTGEPFGGQVARETGLVNESVPLARLRERTRELAKVLLGKNPTVIRQAKNAFKRIGVMDWDLAEDYLAAKAEQTAAQDPEGGRNKGMKQFLDEKSIRPGLDTYRRDS